LQGLDTGQAFAFPEGLRAVRGVLGSQVQDPGPALIGIVQIAAYFQQAGMLDVGRQKIGRILVNLAQQARRLGIVGKFRGGNRFGQHPLRFFNERVGGGDGRQVNHRCVGIDGREIGFGQQLMGRGGGEALFAKRSGGTAGVVGEGGDGNGRGGAGQGNDGRRGRGLAGGFGLVLAPGELSRADFPDAVAFMAQHINGFGLGGDEVAGPVQQVGQQAEFQEEEGDNHQSGGRLQEAEAGPVAAGLRRDDVFKPDLRLAQHQHIVVGQPDGFGDGLAVVFEGEPGSEAGDINSGAPFLEAGMLEGQLVVVGQPQMAFRRPPNDGQGLADHEALALVASG